ncbi:MAG: hypothetical protein ABI598_03315 [Chloroflexota bacterium]
MGRRTAAFLAAAFGGAYEIFGAIVGQGMQGHGMLFGLAGEETKSAAVVIAFVLATVTIVSAVSIMLVRDTRKLSIVIIIAGLAGTLVAGQTFGYGAALALVGALIATRVDRTAPLF